MRKNILILMHNDATQFIDIVNQYHRLFDTAQYKVTTVYLSGKASETTKERTLTEEVIFLEQDKSALRGLKIGLIRKLFSLCREKQFTMVICHRYKPSYIMLWVALFCRIPALFCVMHELGTMSLRLRQWLLTALQRKNMLLAGVSNAVRDNLRHDLKRVPQTHIITLYNVIDIEYTEPLLLNRIAARQALQLPEDAIVFGNIARLAPNKDHDTLLQAFAAMKTKCPQAKLVIIGDGILEATLKKQAILLGLEQDVIFTGYLANGFQYLKAFDAFVLSSIQEAFGRVLLEAMIAKLPIIATRVNGIPEVMGDSGTLIPAKDISALKEAMHDLYHLDIHARQSIGEKAYQRVTHHFSIPCFQKQFWQLPLLTSMKENL